MPVPFFANTVTDKQVLQSQYGVSQVIELAAAPRFTSPALVKSIPQLHFHRRHAR